MAAMSKLVLFFYFISSKKDKKNFFLAKSVRKRNEINVSVLIVCFNDSKITGKLSINYELVCVSARHESETSWQTMGHLYSSPEQRHHLQSSLDTVT